MQETAGGAAVPFGTPLSAPDTDIAADAAREQLRQEAMVVS
jgi:hypothetical protein